MTACKLSLEPILSYWTYFASVCIEEVMSVIEMVVVEKDDREVGRQGVEEG